MRGTKRLLFGEHIARSEDVGRDPFLKRTSGFRRTVPHNPRAIGLGETLSGRATPRIVRWGGWTGRKNDAHAPNGCSEGARRARARTSVPWLLGEQAMGAGNEGCCCFRSMLRVGEKPARLFFTGGPSGRATHDASKDYGH